MSTDQSRDIQIVAMHLGNEVFGIDIAHIHTVIAPQAITPVPQTPKYVLGVMNLRGRILPIIDLRTRFNIAGAAQGAGSRVVIVEADGLSAGLVVDAVSEVFRLCSDAIQPPADILNSAEADFIVGIARMPVKGGAAGEECFVVLIDVLKTLSTNPFDAATLANLSGAA